MRAEAGREHAEWHRGEHSAAEAGEKQQPDEREEVGKHARGGADGTSGNSLAPLSLPRRLLALLATIATFALKTSSALNASVGSGHGFLPPQPAIAT